MTNGYLRSVLFFLFSGKVDWSAVKVQLAETVELAQRQLLAAADYAKQLVK